MKKTDRYKAENEHSDGMNSMCKGPRAKTSMMGKKLKNAGMAEIEKGRRRRMTK